MRDLPFIGRRSSFDIPHTTYEMRDTKMTKAKRLSVRQLAFLGDLFGGKLDEEQTLKKHRVSHRLYNKWLTDPAFAEQFDRRIAGVYRQSELLIAHSATEALEELMKLIREEKTVKGKKEQKGETARKACLDVIKMHLSPRQAGRPKIPTKKATPSPEPPELPQLSPETASKLLAVLAEEKAG